jgi:hypothetical protein
MLIGFISFNLMHPVRGATVGLLPDKLLAGFQSTHPMQGATGADSVYKVKFDISI